MLVGGMVGVAAFVFVGLMGAALIYQEAGRESPSKAEKATRDKAAPESATQ
eukprot:CAMPEP_0173384274 /NCGR_PEP_ID=MMETSP1356-20130122/6843_1 /TAXON_ID=77927 ORGANISM="Hemiselmis virescens, Strain PCC157" /NCGR_SAMPLE_ID=MMETSP1356 /ASSEMBLY_ACC=CAM_ASM_000847 /LENGTH=50 /DNA_ID=CAMNT_0014339537 /DNA_START=1 /DNA_END=153 /DNA_ORIENTATION=+